MTNLRLELEHTRHPTGVPTKAILFRMRLFCLQLEGSFLLTVELFYLQLTIGAFLLTVGAFLLTVLAFFTYKWSVFCLQWESVSNKGLKRL